MPILLSLLLGMVIGNPQSTLSQMPNYDKFDKARRAYYGLIDRGIDNVDWATDSTHFTYFQSGELKSYDVAGLKATPTNTPASQEKPKNSPPTRKAPDRGAQYTEAYSENGEWKSSTQNGNLFLTHIKSKSKVALSNDGGAKTRIKYGQASWVYGEELGVRETMLFSPDSRYLAYYRFDESKVKDYYIGYDQLKDQDTLNTEAYPLAGAPNPSAELFIYDTKSKSTVKVDTTFGNPEEAEYIYQVQWVPEHDKLLFYRANRIQNILDVCISDPATGKCKQLLQEARTDGWIDTNRYANLGLKFLSDDQRFLWISDRSGYRNIYLGDLDGSPLKPLTNLEADVEQISTVVKATNTVFFTARNGDNPYLLQLNKVSLKGGASELVTSSKLSHKCFVSPDGHHIVDVAENLETPPVTNLLDGSGTVIANLSRADTTKMESLGIRPTKRFTVMSADGKYTLYGTLGLPSDFDPSKKYPMVVSMYGGPESGGSPEVYSPSDPTSEFGFITMTMDGRGSAGRGRAFMCSVYRHLGIAEIDDCASAVTQLAEKYSYIDGKNVGINGTSYGGYFSALSIVRYPKVYRASCASSPVTDFRLYDSIYTERYMGLPTKEDNFDGYEAGSCMTYAKDLAGWLELYYGTADNNVHNTNTLRLVQKLEDVGKHYDILVGPDRGHSQMPSSRIYEYFIQHLMSKQEVTLTNRYWNKKKELFGVLLSIDRSTEAELKALNKKRKTLKLPEVKHPIR